MNCLLDTHAFVWWVAGEEREIGATARNLIRDQDNRIFVGAISLYEIVLKFRLGKWPAVERIARDPVAVAVRSDIEILAVDGRHATVAAELALDHRDPFDRIIAAQAIVHGLTVLSLDPRLESFGVDVVW